MRVRLAAPARTELPDAQFYYERERPGLGLAFSKAVASACARMGAMPRMYPVEVGDVRKLSLTRFPYKFLFAERADGIGRAVGRALPLRDGARPQWAAIDALLPAG